MALLHFQHIETEIANDSIERYGGIIEKCAQQSVVTDYQLLKRTLLS